MSKDNSKIVLIAKWARISEIEEDSRYEMKLYDEFKLLTVDDVIKRYDLSDSLEEYCEGELPVEEDKIEIIEGYFYDDWLEIVEFHATVEDANKSKQAYQKDVERYYELSKNGAIKEWQVQCRENSDYYNTMFTVLDE